MTPIIDYQKIADAKKYYESLGYCEIPVPWIIQHEAYGATKPPGKKDFFALGGYLNASAEQSFIELMLRGQKLSRHLAITPCFRHEEPIDDLHHEYFVKLELIDTDVTCHKREGLFRMIEEARRFFERYTPVEVITLESVDSSDPLYDIVDKKNHIELGSYGIRQFRNFMWIYGTGLALPRLDTVMQKQHRKKERQQHA